jgi:hypothetical protein
MEKALRPFLCTPAFFRLERHCFQNAYANDAILDQMRRMEFTTEIGNPCLESKRFCVNCSSHFRALRPSIKNIVVSRRFLRDLKDESELKSIIDDVLDCSHLEFHELHKFERNVDGNLIFRAKKEHLHIVYGVDKDLNIIFMRAIRSFTSYKRFLENKKEILRMISHAPT